MSRFLRITASGNIYEILVGTYEGKENNANVLDVYRIQVKNQPKNEEACLNALKYMTLLKLEESERLGLVDSCLETIDNSYVLYKNRLDLLENQIRAEVAALPRQERPSSKATSALVSDYLEVYVDEQLEAHPNRAALFACKARLIRESEGNEAALAYLDSMIAPGNTDVGPLVVKAALLNDMKRTAEAIELLQSKASENGVLTNRIYREQLAYLLVKDKQHDKLEKLVQDTKAIMDESDWQKFSELVAVNKNLKNCAVLGSGSSSQQTGYYDGDESKDNEYWSGRSVSGGWIRNQCKNTPISVRVRVSTTIKSVQAMFIFSETTYSTKEKYFTFNDLEPGEVRKFSSSAELSTLRLGV